MKRLLDNLMLLAVMIGAAYGLYWYLTDPPEKQSARIRYKENDQATMFHLREDGGNNLDDCYRYTNPDSVQGCLEQRGESSETD